MKYSNKFIPAGLGQIERERLSKLLRETKLTISVREAALVLEMNSKQAAKVLALYCKKNWLKRICRGVYLPVPLESPTSDIVAEEPFAIAEKIFCPCYIGGMNAANYWDFTEQIFRTITVMTKKMVKNRNVEIAGAEYLIHTIKPRLFFGFIYVWFNGVKVSISDPTKMIVDMMLFPQFCGGLRFIFDVLQSYFASKHKNIDLLINYLSKAQNGAAIKRIGFLTEKCSNKEEKLTNFCLKNSTKGYNKIIPSMNCQRLIRRWGLWVPDNWKNKK